MESKYLNVKLNKIPTLNTERLSTQHSLLRFRTLPSLLTDRTEKSRTQLCQLFRANSRKTPRQMPQSKLSYHRDQHKIIIEKVYKEYLKDKQLVNQLTTKGLRSHFKPKCNRIKTMEQMIENIDENNSPIQEQIKIADFMLNPKNSTLHNIELLEDHFNYGDETPAKLKNFSKNVVSFANNLQTYLTKQKTQKLLNIQSQKLMNIQI